MKIRLLICCLCLHQLCLHPLAHAESSHAESEVELSNIESQLNQQLNTELPLAVSSALGKIGVPENSVSVYVQPLAQQPAQLSLPILAHQATVALNPASTMKLLTSYVSLSLLGPAYRWKTEIYHDGSLKNGVLDGNVYLKAYGDPNFTTADFWRLLNSLRQLGINEIKGNLIVDNSYFASESQSAGNFDGDEVRAYNAPPSALAINLKASSFRFDSDGSHVSIAQEPNLAEIKIKNMLKVGKADCASWRNTFSYDVQQIGDISTVTFVGTYAPNCHQKYLELVAIDENNYTLALFRQLWLELGGSFNGKIETSNVPADATKLLQQDSKTLAQILPDMNKWSNNLMARQMLLTIAAEKVTLPATESNGVLAVKQWLNSIGLSFDELVIENGSGLSRLERISAQHMGVLLVNAYYSAVMPELISSLPILAVDGTMQRRMKESILQGKAHLKTGTINSVFTLAGYVLGQDNKRYVVVFMANHPNATLTKPAQDALLEWVYVQ